MDATLYSIRSDDLEDFLRNLRERQAVVEGISSAMQMLEESQLREEARRIIGGSNAATGLADVLSACAVELRLDIEQFKKQLEKQSGKARAGKVGAR